MFTLTKEIVLRYYTNLVLEEHLKNIEGEITLDKIPNNIIETTKAIGFALTKEELKTRIDEKHTKKANIEKVKAKFSIAKDAKEVASAGVKPDGFVSLMSMVSTEAQQLNDELQILISKPDVTEGEITSVIVSSR